MKKMLFLVATLSCMILAGCGSQNDDISARLDAIEQRLSALENTGTASSQSVESSSTKNTSAPTSQTADNSDNKDLDILSFEVTATDTEYSKSWVKHTYKVTNNGTSPIEYISLDFAYYDADGNILDTDARSKDLVIEPQKSVIVDSIAGDESFKSSIASSRVTAYYYYLVTPLPDGSNRISVNCETGKIKTSYYER